MPAYGSGDYEHFYPRSPCGERRGIHIIWAYTSKFLSTLSLRRATSFIVYSITGKYISIHALLAESDMSGTDFYRSAIISIHALLAESDRAYQRYFAPDENFYPRSPCGERHAGVHHIRHHNNFYPRSPCGERLIMGGPGMTILPFLSTLSLRRATTEMRLALDDIKISIHALLAESDVWGPQARAPKGDFYPRSPCGERPTCRHTAQATMSISIHALLAESDPHTI